MTPEGMQARLLYRDGMMLVIDKPAGLAVHKGPKGGVNLEDFFDALRFGLPRRPALAHRLDRDTSGCLVLGRHRKALAELATLFKRGLIGKTYWAVVEGGPEQDEGRIELPLGRLDTKRGWWMKPDSKGQPAVTLWKVLGRSAIFISPSGPAGFAADPALQAEGTRTFTWLALEPLTGRTHQLRVHCAALGRAAAASARARGCGAAVQEPRSDSRHRAGSGAHAGAAQRLRVARRTGRASCPHRSRRTPHALLLEVRTKNG